MQVFHFDSQKRKVVPTFMGHFAGTLDQKLLQMSNDDAETATLALRDCLNSHAKYSKVNLRSTSGAQQARMRLIEFRYFIHRELLQSFSMGYQSKVLTVPLEWLSEVLLIDSMEHLEQDCKYYGITVDRKTKTAKFAKADFNAVIPVVRASAIKR